ncbi:Leucine Rich Repeat family protein [Trichomonas vaginalis G3]|uniref:Leucine Rich Repeat family protein n=1 Tax=Trichomonas vaginalis (strain ATCC PRA-98 / G3) TaxID=412133 RepID=A2ENW7_TRIV3|nr:uncharacterized protein TVAGG3_0249500 [Trichomonas vaginalis G3]EAY05657.1 Leucine Rich Repeat family protein [Trichomonas vaginalis G3]KAI5553897.1 axoneme assembly [Trichomonas vaginalis G3]|eukprot:XP_001317880.1 hypothetical protein [Trichomonas vaginalis G3]
MRKAKPSVSLLSESDAVSSFQSRGIKTLKGAKIPAAPALDLSNNQLASLQGLPSPQIIKLLQLSHNNISTIEEDPFKYCTSLTYLDLSYNNISKMERLFYIANLHSLNLSENQIEVIENLEGCVSLKQLNLSNNKIRFIYIRSPIPRLVSLDISGNQFRSLHGMGVFSGLSTLIMDRGILTNLNGIRSLLNLRSLSAVHNKITDFPPFYMALLTYVDLSYNNLISLTPLTGFQSLVTLDISFNPFDDKSLIIDAFFPQLKEFRANSTKISKLSPLATVAPNLVAVSLTYCKLNSMDDILNFVANVKTLKYLDIRGNPVNSNLYQDIPPILQDDMELPEYESEEIYNKQFGANSARKEYRDRIISSATGEIAWLDGVRCPGKNDDAVPPSRMNFMDENDIQEPQSELPVPVRPVLESAQYSTDSEPDRNDNSISESNYDNPIDDFEQLDKVPNINDEEIIESPPRKIKKVKRKIPSEKSPKHQQFEAEFPVYDQEANGYGTSPSMLDSCEDSGPYEVDHQKAGIEQTAPGLFGFVADEKSDSSEFEEDRKYVAATDAESEFAYEKYVPKKRINHKEAPNYQDRLMENTEYKKGGMQFWVPVRNSENSGIRKSTSPKNSPPKPNGQRYPPFRNLPYQKPLPQGTYPFNLKEERRLPWDKTETPSYAKKVNKKRSK